MEEKIQRKGARAVGEGGSKNTMGWNARESERKQRERARIMEVSEKENGIRERNGMEQELWEGKRENATKESEKGELG